MGVLQIILLLGCVYFGNASQHTHVIPVEGYETELQDLGQHVDHHETPVKVIKITKTIAVKVPVPYPVKVVQKVPYPVHIVKPYPVPVPHIVNVPHGGHKLPHEGAAAGGEGPAYQVQEAPDAHSFSPQQDSYNGGGHGRNVESYAEEYPSRDDGSYEAPSNVYHGHSGSSHAADDTRSYDEAIQSYLNNIHANNGGHQFNE